MPLQGTQSMWEQMGMFPCIQSQFFVPPVIMISLHETNIAPETSPSQKEFHLPTIDFQNQTVSYREGIH